MSKAKLMTLFNSLIHRDRKWLQTILACIKVCRLSKEELTELCIQFYVFISLFSFFVSLLYKVIQDRFGICSQTFEPLVWSVNLQILSLSAVLRIPVTWELVN